MAAPAASCHRDPASRWRLYSDLAALIGTAPQPLGNYLATVTTLGAHRVLKAGGWISDAFQWIEEGRGDDPRDVLTAEGVRFSAAVAPPPPSASPPKTSPS